MASLVAKPAQIEKSQQIKFYRPNCQSIQTSQVVLPRKKADLNSKSTIHTKSINISILNNEPVLVAYQDQPKQDITRRGSQCFKNDSRYLNSSQLHSTQIGSSKQLVSTQPTKQSSAVNSPRVSVQEFVPSSQERKLSNNRAKLSRQTPASTVGLFTYQLANSNSNMFFEEKRPALTNEM